MNPSTLPFQVRVVQREVVGDDIVILELRAADGGLLPPFSAGAHVELLLASGPRHYSLCESPLQRERYRIGVHRVANGRGGSIEVFDRIRVGQLLDLRGPFNHFALQPSDAPDLFIGGGIGITPLLAMAWQDLALGHPFTLHYSGRELRRMPFVDLLVHGAPSTHCHIYADDGVGAPPMCLDAAVGRPLPGQQLYVCGPAGMIAAVCDTARRQGWADDQVHFEHFGAPAATAGSDSDGSFEVQLASSGRCIRVDAQQTVAQALEQAGIHIPVSCGAGVCGSCRIRILEGVPEHRDLFYTPQQQARGDEFTPCCSRARSERLVLDL